MARLLAGPTYVVPRAHDIVVGGTDEEGDWSRTPSPETARAILARARRLVPELRARRCSGTGRAAARCARRYGSSASGDVVHCYGHGGAGVTLSWGTADEVVGPGARGRSESERVARTPRPRRR